VALAVILPVACAQEETPPELPIEAIHALYAVAVATPTGFIIAFLTSMAGYFSKTQPEKFKLENFLYTAAISVAIGTVTVYSGLPQQSALIMVTTWLANGYLTWYIWKLSTIVARALAKKGMWIPQPTGPPATA
jgi:hypothetical protein